MTLRSIVRGETLEGTASYVPVAGHPVASGGSLAPSSTGDFESMSGVSENRTEIN